jgi:murein DD-endopeptidase MepM/ murein hydrolase activator NlpD
MRRHKRRVIAVVITAVVLFLMFIASVIYIPTKQFTAEPQFEAAPRIPLGTEHTTTAPPKLYAKKTSERQIRPQSIIKPSYQRVVIGVGESLSHVFDTLHISPQQLHKIAQLPEIKKAVRRLQAGQELEFEVDMNNQLQTLIMPLNGSQDIKVTRAGESFTEKLIAHQFNTSNKLLTATIHSSLYTAGAKAEIPKSVLAQFTKIFSWQIDFRRDIRDGDKIRVLYEEMRNLKTNKIEPGDIIAAAYSHNNKTYYAFKYRDHFGRVGYFDENGRSLRKAFRRNPLNIGYVSSGFRLHRKHPLLGIVRPHTGTDFAAAYGTPIHATGAGRIIFRGRKGGYGRCIVIDHGNNITTLYGHMSRFNNKFKSGSYVKMNDVIGYIGTSGLASGPHVHYEYRIKHQYKNPVKVKLPNAAPVPQSERGKFKQYAEAEIKKLDPANYNTDD